MAALDNQFTDTPSEVHQEDVWPLEGTGAQKMQDGTEKSGRVRTADNEDRMDLLKLEDGQDGSSKRSGKVVPDASSH